MELVKVAGYFYPEDNCLFDSVIFKFLGFPCPLGAVEYNHTAQTYYFDYIGRSHFQAIELGVEELCLSTVISLVLYSSPKI